MAREEDLVPDLIMIDGHLIAEAFQLLIWVRDEIRLVDIDVVSGDVHANILTGLCIEICSGKKSCKSLLSRIAGISTDF